MTIFNLLTSTESLSWARSQMGTIVCVMSLPNWKCPARTWPPPAHAHMSLVYVHHCIKETLLYTVSVLR